MLFFGRSVCRPATEREMLTIENKVRKTEISTKMYKKYATTIASHNICTALIIAASEFIEVACAHFSIIWATILNGFRLNSNHISNCFVHWMVYARLGSASKGQWYKCKCWVAFSCVSFAMHVNLHLIGVLFVQKVRNIKMKCKSVSTGIGTGNWKRTDGTGRKTQIDFHMINYRQMGLS